MTRERYTKQIQNTSSPFLRHFSNLLCQLPSNSPIIQKAPSLWLFSHGLSPCLTHQEGLNLSSGYTLDLNGFLPPFFSSTVFILKKWTLKVKHQPLSRMEHHWNPSCYVLWFQMWCGFPGLSSLWVPRAYFLLWSKVKRPMARSPHPLKTLPLLGFPHQGILRVKRTMTCSTCLFCWSCLSAAHPQSGLLLHCSLLSTELCTRKRGLWTGCNQFGNHSSFLVCDITLVTPKEFEVGDRWTLPHNLATML